jgi:Gluconate 2-dehydrogenase subunit 3
MAAPERCFLNQGFDKTAREKTKTMQRRDFIKAMAAASVAAKSMLGQQAAAPNQVAPSTPPAAPPPAPTAPGPVPWMHGLEEVKPLHIAQLVPDAVAQTNTHFFSDQQRATLHRFCEVMVPPLKGFPGAIDAGAPDFLDFLIGASPADHQQMYRTGLDRLESDSKQGFSKPFANTDAAQADQVIRPWLRTWMSDNPPKEPHAHFINLAHSDIRTATVNSQAWSEAAKAAGEREPNVGLFWFPVDPDLRREAISPSRRTVPQRHS